MKRFFGSRDRIALYLAADGKCERCGDDLPESWHADHVRPWSRGGETDVANGQALCPKCNLTKGDFMARQLELRDWQQSALDKAFAAFKDGRQVFAVGAGVGSGKTIFGSALTRRLFDSGSIDRVIVISPSESIQAGWSGDLSSLFGLRIRDDVAGHLHASEHGFSATYQWVIWNVSLCKLLCSQLRGGASCRTLVILDEAHHPGETAEGEATAWGKAIKTAFEGAKHILLLSGTPGRSDGLRIPFMPYRPDPESGDDTAVLDVCYSYGQAVDDGVVRRCAFPPVEAIGHIELEDGTITASTGDKRSRERAAIERAALNIDGDMGNGIYGDGAERILDVAVTELRRLRRGHPRAGLLAVCDNQKHAEYIAQCLRSLGLTVVVVHSDVKHAHKIIDAYRKSSVDCIVAVQMVAEGVSIQRLRVCAYLTRRSTTLALDQIMGRVVRVDWREDGNPTGEAVVLDDDGNQAPPGEAVFVHLNKPELMEWATSVEQEIVAAAKAADDERAKRAQSSDDWLSEFPALDVVSLRADALGEIIAGQSFDSDVVRLLSEYRDQNPDVKLPRLDAYRLIQFCNKEQRDLATAEVAPVPSASYADEIEAERKKCHLAVQRICRKRKSDNFKAIHTWANERAGIKEQGKASLEELKVKFAILTELEKRSAA